MGKTLSTESRLNARLVTISPSGDGHWHCVVLPRLPKGSLKRAPVVSCASDPIALCASGCSVRAHDCRRMIVASSWRRNRLVRQIRIRPRLYVSLLVAILIGVSLPTEFASHQITRLLIAWNAGAGLYVALATVMMVRSTHQHMRHRAQLQDDGQLIILALVVVAGVASLAAIGGELAVVKDMHGSVKIAHIVLAGLTVLSSWAFIQVMFCLHYAHDYYAAACHGHPAGLQFPNDEQPDYGDFFHFAAVIGTSGQTADINFASKAMRRIGTVHCILAYLFNTTVLALLINIGAGLF